jgi:hypothetical protein
MLVILYGIPVLIKPLNFLQANSFFLRSLFGSIYLSIVKAVIYGTGFCSLLLSGN